MQQIMAQEDDFNFDITNNNLDTNSEQKTSDDKSKIKEVFDFIEARGKNNISDVEKNVLIKLANDGKINFNNFEIAIEEFLNKTDKYQSIFDVMEEFGFVSKQEVNKTIKYFKSQTVNNEFDIDESSDNQNIKNIKINNVSNTIENNDVNNIDFKISLIDKNVAKRIDSSIVNELSVIPFKIVNKILYLVSDNDIDNDAISKIMQFYQECTDSKQQVADTSVINETIDLIYNQKDDLDEIIDKITKSTMKLSIGTKKDIKKEYSIPKDLITSLVDTIISNSVKMGASDIHIEPEENFVRIRYRIDGDMKIIKSIHKEYWTNILVRLKVISGLNIAEIRRPQDGKISMNIYKRQIDCRVSTQPTIYGENVVIRILDKQKGLIGLEELGFYSDNLKSIQKANDRPDGIVIVVGPTGSGKTTTLYSMISQLNTPDVNIMTLEDPVEYNIPMIRQININELVGLTFESGMRSLVRQDPDIILVGEIRDKETLQAALRMSMTGHKVFSSLHAIDSVSAIQRLMDIGADVGSLVGNIGAIMSQRLVKKLCSNCKQKQEIDSQIIDDFKLTSDEVQNSKACMLHGCEDCAGTGYKGRMVLAEVLLFSEELDELIYQKASQPQLKRFLRENNFTSMSKDAKMKFLNGDISLEEIKKTIKIVI